MAAPTLLKTWYRIVSLMEIVGSRGRVDENWRLGWRDSASLRSPVVTVTSMLVRMRWWLRLRSGLSTAVRSSTPKSRSKARGQCADAGSSA